MSNKYLEKIAEIHPALGALGGAALGGMGGGFVGGVAAAPILALALKAESPHLAAAGLVAPAVSSAAGMVYGAYKGYKVSKEHNEAQRALKKHASVGELVEDGIKAFKRAPTRLAQPIHPEQMMGPKAPDLLDRAHRLASNMSNRAAKHGITGTHLGMAGMGAGGLAVGHMMSGGNGNN